MLLDEDNVLVAITGDQRFRCQVPDGCKERASWITEPAAGGDAIKMCAWHVFYGGSKWGIERKEEIAVAGRTIQAFALKNRGPHTDVPDLDPRGRLKPVHAERYLLGIKESTGFTKRLMQRIGIRSAILGHGRSDKP